MNIEKLRILNKEILPVNIRNPYIVVIGNGGATPQDNEEIKKANLVVRFNNYGSREGIVHTEDRLRCDVLFTTYDLHTAQSKPRHVVIGIPFPFKAESIVSKMDKWYPNSMHWTVNPYLNLLMCRELDIKSDGHHHPLPSIGLTAVWHLLKFTKRLYIGGFNWYHNKDEVFQNRPLTNTRRPTHVNHDYHIEARWFANLRKNINIKFSDHCNSLLDIVDKYS